MARKSKRTAPVATVPEPVQEQEPQSLAQLPHLEKIRLHSLEAQAEAVRSISDLDGWRNQVITELEAWRTEVDATIAFLKAQRK